MIATQYFYDYRETAREIKPNGFSELLSVELFYQICLSKIADPSCHFHHYSNLFFANS